MEVNIGKTKIVVFKKGHGKVSCGNFYYKNQRLEIVSTVRYLGVLLSNTGVFYATCKDMINKATSASGVVRNILCKVKADSLEPKITLFNSMVRSVLCYCGEIWALRYLEELEVVQSKFIKSIFYWPRTTPGYLVRLEVGCVKLSYHLIKLSINWWIKLLKMSPERLPRVCFDRLVALDRNGSQVKYNWVAQLRTIIAELGYEGNLIWDTSDPKEIINFKKEFLQRYHAHLVNADVNRMGASSYSLLYSELYTGHLPENYSNKQLPFYMLKVLSQIRVSSAEKIVIYLKSNKYEINFTAPCNLCLYENDSLEHIFCDCIYFQHFRVAYLRKYNTRNFQNLLSLQHKEVVQDVFNFICNSLKLRAFLLNE